MKTIDIVIGLNYGDEGKGATVNRIAASYFGKGSTAVIKHNGGAQAGHTVEHNNLRLVFKQLGSGSLWEASTILSDRFVFNPMTFYDEANEYIHLVKPSVINWFLDPLCKVTTPYHILVNREKESLHQKHGSCGMGIFETEVCDSYTLGIRVEDFQDLTLVRMKLAAIRDQYVSTRLGYSPAQLKEYSDIYDDLFIARCKDACQMFNIQKSWESMDLHDHLIFESAQGLLLDQNAPGFPHLTPSNTGLTNVVELLSTLPSASYDKIKVHYVTRPYLTRHGEGPLRGEVPELMIEDKTNVTNHWQGHFRFAPLDFETMEKAVTKDRENLRYEFGKVEVNTHVTCCDQWGRVSPIYPKDDFYSLVRTIKRATKAREVFMHYAPDALPNQEWNKYGIDEENKLKAFG